jgi:hypothetical protein
MNRNVIRAVRACLAVGAAAAVMLTVTADASLAAPCSYNGCSAKDPKTTGCATRATTLKEYTFNDRGGDYRVELRYSPACHAVWVRMTSVSCNAPKAFMETGYLDYYSAYHLQGRFLGPGTMSGCGAPRHATWTPMSSSSRERIRLGYASSSSSAPSGYRTYKTGCNDCSG